MSIIMSACAFAQRRIMLGLTQQQMAELIGVDLSAGTQVRDRHQPIRPVAIPDRPGLGLDISYFFEDVDPEHRNKPKTTEMMPQQRMLLELARNFASITSRKHQDALCNLAGCLANVEAGRGDRPRGRRSGARPQPQPMIRKVSDHSPSSASCSGANQRPPPHRRRRRLPIGASAEKSIRV